MRVAGLQARTSVSVKTIPKKNKRTTVSLAQPRSNGNRKSICSVLDALHVRQLVVINVDLHFFHLRAKVQAGLPMTTKLLGRYRSSNAALWILFVFQ
jgi:hypothetical protein